MTRPTNEDEFGVRLKAFKKSIKHAMDACRDCAEFALEHYKKSGDLFPMQQLHDAIPKDYGRRPALVRWACHFGNISLETGTFKKDHNHPTVKEMADIDLEAAWAKPFWEFAPEKQIDNYTITDVVKGIDAVFSRFENEKSFHALTKKDKEKVTNLHDFWNVKKADIEATEESVAA